MSSPRQWQLEALCTYIGQLAARSSEEERSDLEQQEIFHAAKEQYPNEFAMGEAYIYENPGSNGEATLAQAKDSIFFRLENLNLFERCIYTAYSLFHYASLVIVAAFALTVLFNLFTLYDLALAPQDLIFADINLNLFVETILRLLVVLVTVMLMGTVLGVLIIVTMFLAPFFELYGTTISDTIGGMVMELGLRSLSETLWVASYFSIILWGLIFYIGFTSLKSGEKAFKLASWWD